MNLMELEERIRLAEEQTKILLEERKYLQKKYDKLYYEHQSFLKRKKAYKLNKGKCVYLANVGTEDSMILKIGRTDDIMSHFSNIRKINPYCKLLFLMYSQLNTDIEDAILKIYGQSSNTCRSIVNGVSFEDLVQHIIDLAEVFRCKYEVETIEQLENFNSYAVRNEQPIADTPAESNDIPTTKRCGGLTHKTEEERILPLSAFFKNKNNSDGHARLCKECYLTGVYGDQRKRRKIVVIPQFDPNTHKWCNRCESVKEHDDFYNCASTKDGKSANCKACKTEQKKIKQSQKNNTTIETET